MEIRTKFWVAKELPYDWLIGRQLEAALGIVPRLEWELYSWAAPKVDDGEAELNALDAQSGDVSSSFLPDFEIDLGQISSGRPELLPQIEAMLY